MQPLPARVLSAANFSDTNCPSGVSADEQIAEAWRWWEGEVSRYLGLDPLPLSESCELQSGWGQLFSQHCSHPGKPRQGHGPLAWRRQGRVSAAAQPACSCPSSISLYCGCCFSFDTW